MLGLQADECAPKNMVCLFSAGQYNSFEGLAERIQLIKIIYEGFALPPVCTLHVRADGLGRPTGR